MIVSHYNFRTLIYEEVWNYLLVADTTLKNTQKECEITLINEFRLILFYFVYTCLYLSKNYFVKTEFVMHQL